MIQSSSVHLQALVPNQLQQTWLRLLFMLLAGLYAYAHGPLFSQYGEFLLSLAAVYSIWQFYSLYSIRRTPLSAFRVLVSPLMDTILISTAIIADGGQSSGLFLVYFVMIMGNGLRFGNTTLLYSQALACIGYLIACTFVHLDAHIELDYLFLSLQSLSLIIIPAYAYMASNLARTAIESKEKAESLSFGLLDRSPLPAFTFQADGDNAPRIIYANSAMQEVYRESNSSLIGEQVDMIALMEDGPEIIKACSSVFTSGQTQTERFYIRGRNIQDNALQLMGQANSLCLQDKVIGICFLVDITKNETLRSEMQQNMHDGYMSTLVAGIVHDFRNVLTSIIGSAEVMQFSTADQSMIDQLGLIIEAGERGSEMTSHLLTLGKSENAEIKMSDGKSMHDSLTSMIGLLRIQLPAHIQLHLDIDQRLPAVNINLTQLEQILMNLVKNATEAMPDAGTIHVQLYSNFTDPMAEPHMPALCLCVSDEGQGIAAEDIEKVSKPFWTSNKEGGTGLGLSMVQRIVRNHGGRFHIQSRVAHGTSITITFPAGKANPTAHIKPIKPLNSTKSSDSHGPSSKHQEKTPIDKKPAENITPWNILLVDDSPEVLHVHQHLLERMQHTIIPATSGEHAIQEWHKVHQQHGQSIDMVITDFRMPGMDGMDLCRLIRQQNKDIPILMITAYGEADKLKESSSLVIDILGKPTSFKRLEAKVLDIQQRQASKC